MKFSEVNKLPTVSKSVQRVNPAKRVLDEEMVDEVYNLPHMPKSHPKHKDMCKYVQNIKKHSPALASSMLHWD